MRPTALAVTMMLGLGAVCWSSRSNSGRAAPGRDVDKILEFDTMVGVPRPYTGPANAIRGVPGGGLPWVIDEGRGELRTTGGIEVLVAGLVLDPDDGGVPPALKGTNPIASFRAIVSCLSVDGNGNAITVNIPTAEFPATSSGDCVIEDVVALPEPCIAPIIFVTSPTGSWFSATGF